jgi:hypothetical protein
VRHAGFRFAAVEGTATDFAFLGERADNAEADGVAESVENLLEGDLLDLWMLKRSHGNAQDRSEFSCLSSIIIEPSK